MLKFRQMLLCFGAVAAIGGLAACGDDDGGSSGSSTTESASKPISLDVGTKTIEFPAGTKPKIAYFAASGNAYQEAQKNAAESFKAKGVDLTYFDNKFDGATQLKQVQNAIQSKKYNAFVIENIGGEITCNALSKQAPAANIAVVQVINPTCGKSPEPAGDSYWTPGTLATVGGEATIDYYQSFVKAAKELMGSGAHKVGVINGPPLVTSTDNLNKALKDNGIDPVATANSNYTPPDGLKKTQQMLQAHPDIDTIFSIYGDSTLGAIQAIKAAGKTGDIKVFDIGGSTATTKGIVDGKQTMSVPYFPKSHAEGGVQAVLDAFAGKQVPRFSEAFSVGSLAEPYAITKDSAADYNPEY